MGSSSSPDHRHQLGVLVVIWAVDINTVLDCIRTTGSLKAFSSCIGYYIASTWPQVVTDIAHIILVS